MSITPYLDDILTANYGEEVRDSIVAALEECYADATGDPNNYIAAVRALTELYSNLYSEYNGKFDAIGTMINGDTILSTVSVPTETYTILASATLTYGRWLIIYGAQWDTNATGTRWMALNRIEQDPPSSSRYIIHSPGSSVNSITESRVNVYDITEEETIYLWGWQNSGGALNCWPILTAIRVNGQDDSEEETIDIRNAVSSLATDVADAKQDVQSMNNSFATLAQQHSEDVYDIRESIAGNAQVFRNLIDDKALTVDENDYLCLN